MQRLSYFASTKLGVQLSQAQLSVLSEYEHELLAWNRKINLTAIQDPELIWIKHFLDSLTCLLVMRVSNLERVVDVGTGAGFPGIPLKIVYPSIRLTLVESVKKKADFCRYLVNQLGLSGVNVILGRAEEIGQSIEHREQYDWAIARAVAILPVLAEYLLPLVKIGGAMLAMKGDSATAEAHESENAFRILGGHLRRLVPITLPHVVDEHFLVVIDKIAATPQGYPRRVGVPCKKPL
jgi:16S rRNA (guanine527-N7)-methyltransferase